ncbi:monovalent cation/H(+) antiporter subunit G [Parasulfuritortus cantonensis]|uniref:Monovalent cation/H(+) antiporter subunit G n=1 Tax=Parasulfuritortus cantonensis TaxID=2528202 RepID=A0A4V2NWW4_9PROT|nr:monovalent cation/H(+) antiporter subunit G [Parasulfuritortus cantonensis]TCJ18922.1 monovalent cation/H(+) antiporter subunit G [Parasulfuritortus cantonensis]
MRLLADLFLLAGALLCLLAAVGLLRMPDVYNRIQAATKASTLGSVFILVGVGLLEPGWWAKLVAIIGFILFTSPVGSSTLARAFHRAGVAVWQKGQS